MKRPHRCRECGWRGWLFERDRRLTTGGATVYVAAREPDFRAVDAALRDDATQTTFRGLDAPSSPARQ
ncbi:MAG: hypothetical protein GEU82_15495 [Luteitalea sp.]|nr:hypothetical protein [Luteitalea sp.]